MSTGVVRRSVLQHLALIRVPRRLAEERLDQVGELYANGATLDGRQEGHFRAADDEQDIPARHPRLRVVRDTRAGQLREHHREIRDNAGNSATSPRSLRKKELCRREGAFASTWNEININYGTTIAGNRRDN